MAHAKLSPSSSSRWTVCALAPTREAGRRDEAGDAANRGTVAHDIAAKELTLANVKLADLVGKKARVNFDGSVYYVPADFVPPEGAKMYEVDAEIAGWVTSYVGLIRELVAKGNGKLHVEVGVPIDHITDEESAEGTSDAVIEFPGGNWEVNDLKTGSNRVYASEKLDPDTEKGLPTIGPRKPNTQLLMYASGALRKLDVFEEAQSVTLRIVQPSLNHVDEYKMDMNEFHQWVLWVKCRAMDTKVSAPVAHPSFDTCYYCKAKGDCPERAQAVLDVIAPTADGFENIEEKAGVLPDTASTPEEIDMLLDSIISPEIAAISRVFPHLDFIEKWVKDQRERATKAVEAGETITFPNGKVLGYVPGKKGNREWLDGAEEKLKSFGLKKDEMYDQTLISPTKAEALLLGGEKPSKVRWERLQPFITQKEGKPKLAMIDPPQAGFAEQPVVADPQIAIPDDINELF